LNKTTFVPPTSVIRAIALDLDGTLTNDQKQITYRTRTVVRQAIERGVRVILASGRPVLGIKPSADTLELGKYGGYILAYNGGEIIDCKNEKTIYQQLLPIELYRDIVECGRRFGVHALTYDSNGVIAESKTAPYVLKEAYNNTIPITQVDDLASTLSKPVVKFMVVGDPDRIEPCLTYLHDKLRGRANVFLSEPYFIEITYPGVEKASSLKWLLKYIGVSPNELAACGDGLNDLPMLKYAGYSVAVSNAYDEVLKSADYVSLSNNEDGVAHFLEKLIDYQGSVQG
jgi:Cof subfamily protein (haloacid dehalogenase superfamily)